MSTAGPTTRDRLGLTRRRSSAPRGVLVLGMHRSGTSAATRLVSVLGPATCRDDDMVRGPWNPRGHFESRSLMHLDNALLSQAGRTWWYPPPTGDAYAPVMAAVSTTPAQARRVFRRVHRITPWVWKDPRACVLLPFWRQALGPRLAAVVVFRNPLEVAQSLQHRHGLTQSFGVALWERYNRLLLAHVAGLPVLVSRYDDLVADAGRWTDGVGEFLAGLGMEIDTSGAGRTAASFVDPDLRHSSHTRAEIAAVAPDAEVVYEGLEAVLGPTTSFVAPPLPPEPPRVEDELLTLGPERSPDWHPPPWAGRRDGPVAPPGEAPQ
jgi:hypothetical protein